MPLKQSNQTNHKYVGLYCGGGIIILIKKFTTNNGLPSSF